MSISRLEWFAGGYVVGRTRPLKKLLSTPKKNDETPLLDLTIKVVIFIGVTLFLCGAAIWSDLVWCAYKLNGNALDARRDSKIAKCGHNELLSSRAIAKLDSIRDKQLIAKLYKQNERKNAKHHWIRY